MLGAAALALAVAALPLAAQQRRVLHGVVTGTGGAPLGGASVRFVFVARGAEQHDPTDDVRVVTAANGCYRVELLPCAPYRVWCLGAPAADGSRAASAVQIVDAEPFLQLRATHTARAHDLHVHGLDPWRQRAPFRVRVQPAGIQLPGQLVVADDRTMVPPQPVVLPPASPDVNLQLLDRDGDVIASAQPAIDRRDWHWYVAPPCRVDLRTVDERRRPIAGAEIRERVTVVAQRHSGLTVDPPEHAVWRRLGRTDGEGRLRGALCVGDDNTLLAIAPDGAAASTTPGATREQSRREDHGERVLLLAPPVPWRIRLAGPELRREAGGPLVASAGLLRAESTIGPNGEAAFRFAHAQGVAFAAAPHVAWACFLPERLRANAPTPPVAFAVSAAHRPGVRDLSPTWLLQLEIVTPTGSPATHAQVVLGSNRCVSPWSWHAIPDQAGRVAVAATPDDWIVFAHDRAAAGWARVTASPDGPLRIAMQPLPTVRGRVRDRDGRAIAGALLEQVATEWRAPPRADLDPGLDRISLHCTAYAIARCSTDADGMFACAFVQGPTLDWTVRCRDGERTSAPFPLEPTDDLVVELR